MRYPSVLVLFAAVSLAQDTSQTPGTPATEVPDELKSKVSIAMQHVRTNQTAEAKAMFSEILSAKPDLFTIAVERGKLYQQGKDHPKAIADFTAAIVAKPEYADAHFRRCLSHFETGANANAIVDCSKAIELNPNPFEYYYYRGLAHLAARTWDKAATDLAAALERNNEHPDAHLHLARAYTERESWSGHSGSIRLRFNNVPVFQKLTRAAPSSRQPSEIPPGLKKTWQSSPAEPFSQTRLLKSKRQPQFT